MPWSMVITLVVLAWVLQTREPQPFAEDERRAIEQEIESLLGVPPVWKELENFQESICRDDFEDQLTRIFTTGEGWREWIQLDDESASIRTSEGEFVLRFARDEPESAVPRSWKRAAELPPAPDERPLQDLHIAIDPGHLGGEWARVEGRWLQFGDGPPVMEGEMTLLVAQLLKPRLEAMGAQVSLVREDAQPATRLRPDDLLEVAASSSPEPLEDLALRRLAERLFYRTAEIRARAVRVNEEIRPDLVLCLHFNADAWGDPTMPELVAASHFHILLNGAYTDDELAADDQRYAMLEKLLTRTHDEEAAVAASVAAVFAEQSGLPPYLYAADAKHVRPVDGNPYLWARNLIANRLYRCPVLFMEPYVMNSQPDLPRMQAGDYEGLRETDGVMRPSIFREYADALAAGLARHYSTHRRSM
ncbi:MAG: hypothetical protein ACO3RV_02655 [Luteolibacter sp.]